MNSDLAEDKTRGELEKNSARRRQYEMCVWGGAHCTFVGVGGHRKGYFSIEIV